MGILHSKLVADAAPTTLEIPVHRLKRGRIYRYELAGRPVILFWAADQLVLASEICPHLGGPLSDGRLEEDGCALRCPWHGYKYDTRTGAFLENPNERFIQQRIKTTYAQYRPSQPRFKLHLLPYVIEDGILRA
jgi:nitrite reductase/ring-hydroxylating ferredoxin subunit